MSASEKYGKFEEETLKSMESQKGLGRSSSSVGTMLVCYFPLEYRSRWMRS
jgi:hypothetical protein